MKLSITGASGFVGRYVVSEALRRGHSVRALVRPKSELRHLPWIDHQNLEVARTDLRSKHGLSENLRGSDKVVHLAAVKSGDIYDQMAGTVVATENLLEAMQQAEIKHIVAISTFSVYDYRQMWSLSVLTESAPLERRPQDRDSYCQTKLIQEELIRQFATDHGWKWTVVRPGMVFGTDNLWSARLGVQLGNRWWIRISARARLPLTYVENCANAILLCAEREEAVGKIFNIVDDETPTQHRYTRLINNHLAQRSAPPAVPWMFIRSLSSMAHWTNQLCLRGQARLPSVLAPASVHARFKPLRYSGEYLRKTLGWQPPYSLNEALNRCLSKIDKDSCTGSNHQCEGIGYNSDDPPSPDYVKKATFQ